MNNSVQFIVVVLTLLATMLLNPTTALDKTKLATPAKCANACAAVYEPICGGNKAGADVGTSGTDKPVTFGSECVMNNYNCETDKSESTIQSYSGFM